MLTFLEEKATKPVFGFRVVPKILKAGREQIQHIVISI